MMSRLRFVIFWLVMAAIPLQGLAAATMVFCGGAHGSSSIAAAPVVSTDANGQGHDHSQHSLAAKVEAKDNGGSLQNSGSAALPDSVHKCSVCATCSSGIAIAQFTQWPAFSPLPQAELAELFVPIHAPPSVVPDKPPRT